MQVTVCSSKSGAFSNSRMTQNMLISCISLILQVFRIVLEMENPFYSRIMEDIYMLAVILDS